MFDSYIAALESFDAECKEAYSDYVISRFVGMEADTDSAYEAGKAEGEKSKGGALGSIKRFGGEAWNKILGFLRKIWGMLAGIPKAITGGLSKLAGIFKKGPKEIDSDAEIDEAVKNLEEAEKKMNVFSKLIASLRGKLAKVKSKKVEESDISEIKEETDQAEATVAAESFANDADWLFALEAEGDPEPKKTGRKVSMGAIFSRIKNLLTKAGKLSKDAENGEKEAVDAATAASKEDAEPKKQNILMRAFSAIGRGFAAVGRFIQKYVLQPVTTLAGKIRGKFSKKNVENYEGPNPNAEANPA